MSSEKSSVNFWKRGLLWGLVLFVIFSLLIAIFPNAISSKLSLLLGRFISSLVIPVELGLVIRSLFIKIVSVFGISTNAPLQMVVQKPISIILIILKQILAYCIAGVVVGTIIEKIKSRNQ